jgi:hypothetical protein
MLKEKTHGSGLVEKVSLTINLNARLQPMHRHDIEDRLEEALVKANFGTVSGGGTLQNRDTGEVEGCYIVVEVIFPLETSVDFLINIMERFGVPKGSTIFLSEQQVVSFGKREGMALYLNGTNLPAEIYDEYDSNVVHGELGKALGNKGSIFSYWNGPTETAFYLYGTSYEEMKNLIMPFVTAYPLCQESRMVQIA